MNKLADFLWVLQAYLRGKFLRQKTYRPQPLTDAGALFSSVPGGTAERIMRLGRWWGYNPATEKDLLLFFEGDTKVVIDCAASFEARKAKMKIDGYFDPEFNEQNFPIDIKEGQEIFEMRLVNTLQEEEEAVNNGWERAKADHLMAYVASAWDGQTWVAARGSSWRDDDDDLVVPCLVDHAHKRYLYLFNDDGAWNDHYCFLLARKCA